MSAINIRILKNCRAGGTAYVIASGASVDHLSPTFFEDKLTIAVNEMFRHVRPTYAFMHHHQSAQEAIDAGCVLVTSEHDCGFSARRAHAFSGPYFTYRTAENTLSLTPTVNMGALAREADDELIISPSTVAEAIHFAYFLGASSIVLCGVDGGALDGRWCCRGYNGGAQTNPQHVRLTQGILLQVVNAIRAKGVNVYALSPFIGCDLEGHAYQQAPQLEGRALVRALNTINYQETIS